METKNLDETKNLKANDIYRALLQNENHIKNLSQFTSLAEEFNTKITDYDIVKEYLHFSVNCSEILPYIKELSKSDSQNASTLMKVLINILIRVASDLQIYETAGTSIVNDVLLHGMRTIFYFLKEKQKSTRTKLALHLLSAMVALGKHTATQVVSKLDFSHVNFAHLLNRSAPGAEEDVRTAFLNLLVLIITICDNNIIRQIVEVKGFLNNVFPGLVSDHVSTITLVLNTFRTKIIENVAIPKTSKIRLFNDHSLKPVIELITWKGPLKKKKFSKRKLGEDDKPIAYTITEEEAEEVHKCAQEFMISLCCSHKYGIIFRDLSFGSSGRNLNHVITNILKCTVKPYADKLTSDFVMAVLKACPDQFKFFVPILKDNFVPRVSPLWVKAILFFEKVMESFDVTSYLFNAENKASLSIAVAKIFCLPDLISASTITDSLVDGHQFLGHYICYYLSGILKQVKSVTDYCRSPNLNSTYNASELAAFHQTFKSLAIRNLSFSKELQIFWNNIVSKKNDFTGEETLEELTVPSVSERLLNVIKVIKLFQEIFQQSNNNGNFNFLLMLRSLQDCKESMTEKELSLVRLGVVELLAGQEQGSVMLEKEEINIFSVILDVYSNANEADDEQIATNLIHKVLWHTKLFDHCKWEIDLWLDAIKSSKIKNLPSIFELLTDSIKWALQQPDLLLLNSSVKGNLIDPSDGPVDPLKLLKGILDDDDDSEMALESEETSIVPQKQSFSCLFPAVLQNLNLMDKHKKKSCKLFLEKALLSILHHQSNTENFFSLIFQYKEVLDSNTYYKILHDLKETSVSYSEKPCDSDLSQDLKYKRMCKTEKEQDQTFIKSIFDVFWPSLTQILGEEKSKELNYLIDCNNGKAAQLLLQENVSAKRLSKFWKLFLQNPEPTVTPSLSEMEVLLPLLEIWRKHRMERNKTMQPVFKILFQWMTSALSKDFHHGHLVTFITEILQSVDEINITDIHDVKPFFQKALKISFMLGDIGKDIFKVLILLCEKSKGTNLPTQDIHNLVIGHSNFFNIMLSSLKDNNSLKESIVDMLTIIAKIDASVCKEHHISVFLSSYNGTMHCTDQKLLYLIKVYSDNGINMIKYSPFLWGKAAVAHYSIMNNGAGLNLLKQAKLRDIASLILPEKIECTLLHYPLKITLLPSSEVIQDINEMLSPNIYDLRFFLPLLANLLSPGAFVNINCFVESRLLMLIFASLSSFDENIRALGYYCLSQFYHHLESLRSKEKEVWISLLDCIRNSISSLNPKLPCIITLFLARVSDIFTKPKNSLYTVLYKFIMVKPALDLVHVPEFYKLFNSIELEYRSHRLWLLNLLFDGIRTTLDFHICEKRYIFSTLQTHYWSSVSTHEEKVSILRVIASAVRIESSAKTLCQNGLLLWIHSILEQSEVTSDISSIIRQILEDINKIDSSNLSLNLLKKLKKHLFEIPSVQQSSVISTKVS